MADFVDQAGELRALVEDGLAKLFTPSGLLTDAQTPPGLVEPMRYALLGGGKRLRPVLCLAVCQALRGDPSPALPAALAIEVLHNYTLVHDDLPCMDNDLMRRGRPTVHAKFGFGEAVLVGDALQAAAFELALLAPDGCALELARAAGPSGVVGGQWVDVTASAPHDSARVEFVHTHKTGDLISCACSMGAIAAGADSATVALAADFGKSLGIAFQIVDDLLDAGDPDKAQELSILRVVSPDGARIQAQAKTEQALKALDSMVCAQSSDSGNIALKTSAAALLRSLAQSQLSRTV